MRVAGLLRRPEAALFILALGVYAYFFQAGGWNQNARLALVRSLVERGTVTIDGYEESTGDVAFRDGHYYCDKAPGLSFLATPAYAAVDAAAGDARGKGRAISRGAYVSTVWAVAVPSAVAVTALFAAGQALGLSAAAAAGLALAYAFGTLALPYSTLFYGHQLAAALVFVAFTLLLLGRERPDLLRGHRLFVVGLLLGGAVTVEYPSALAVGVVLAYSAAFVRPGRRWLALLVGLALPVLLLCAYHAAAFGSPLRLPYAFSTDAPRHQGWAFGLLGPSPAVLFKLTFSPFRGLFFSSPWLLLAIPGAVLLLRDRRRRPEAVACLAVPLLYLALNASMVDWNGGWGTGPRHLVPALPFLALLAAGVSLLRGRLVALVTAAGAAAAVYSVALMLVATAVKPEVPTWIGRPFGDYLIPRFRAGELSVSTLPVHVPTTRERREAWNLGQLAGLEGLSSLAPLGLWCALGLVWLRRTIASNALTPARPG